MRQNPKKYKSSYSSITRANQNSLVWYLDSGDENTLEKLGLTLEV